MLTVQAKVDIKPLERKFTPAAMRGAKMAVADQVLADTDKYVPRREGDLAASGHVANGGEEVVYNTPYAAAQYRGTNGRQVGSPPRMRVKHAISRDGSVFAGITPAHAGKTLTSACLRLARQDHPRACG